jgi:acid phosphatase (class A)
MKLTGLNIRKRTLVLAGVVVLAAAASPMVSQSFFSGGYLAGADLPDSVKILPPMPAADSGVVKRDEAASQAGLALRGTARWELAKLDAAMFYPTGMSVFSCAAGRIINATETPVTDKLLKRVARDLAGSTGAAKRLYMRHRPFMDNGQPSCTPDMETGLRKDGSYPSGHSAIGYGWGLVLADVLPKQSTALVARGVAFGDSRRVCNVHWLSDVEAGRVMAGATLQKLRSDMAFKADVALARAELAGVVAKPVDAAECGRERAALGLK